MSLELRKVRINGALQYYHAHVKAQAVVEALGKIPPGGVCDQANPVWKASNAHAGMLDRVEAQTRSKHKE